MHAKLNRSSQAIRFIALQAVGVLPSGSCCNRLDQNDKAKGDAGGIDPIYDSDKIGRRMKRTVWEGGIRINPNLIQCLYSVSRELAQMQGNRDSRLGYFDDRRREWPYPILVL